MDPMDVTEAHVKPSSMQSKEALSRHWRLDPDVRPLNHGSFGACPTEVLEHQRTLREELERDAIRFMDDELESRMDAARRVLSMFIGADPDDVVFVSNATHGVNAVLRSMQFASGDELLVTDHEYNACTNALRFVAERWGARIVVVDIATPLHSADEVVESVLDHVSGRTRLALLDHVTSQTGLVLPIARLVRELAAQGVETLVDGAHAPGMVPLDVSGINAAYYTGNCHKWMCGPKGTGFLHVRSDLQGLIHPTVISHGANSTRTDRSRFQLEFGWTGTLDPTPHLCVPKAIETIGAMVAGGWPEVMERNHSLCLQARELVHRRLGFEPIAPDDMIGSMASFRIPNGTGDAPVPGLTLDPLKKALYETHGIQVPVFPWPSFPERMLRISAQLYNSMSDYEALCDALEAELKA
jgi:isopenicillin-N epimerase